MLQAFVRERSEAAFTALVHRHIDAVFAAAVRQVGGDRHLAEDVVQLVFTALARKAPSLVTRLDFCGWLHRATRFAARDIVRAERRRRSREQEFQLMNDDQPGDTSASDDLELRRVLDEVLGELSESDRGAVWSRFCEGRSFAEIGAQLRLSENAARMRVDRALTRMHATLSRRGVKSTLAALALALGRDAGIAAPAGLATTISAHALLAAPCAGGGTALLSYFVMTKTKIALVSGLAIAAVTTTIMEVRATHELQTEIDRLQSTSTARDKLRVEHDRLVGLLATPIEKNPAAEELAGLRARVAVLQARPEGITDAEMKPRSSCRNVGRATPEAAMETLTWALDHGDLDELANCYSFNDSTKTKADAFFGSLSEAVRARLGTAERLFAPVLLQQMKDLPIAAYQVSDTIDPGSDQVQLRFWVRLDSGQERDGGTMPFVRESGGWRFGRIGFDLKIAQIDPATGNLRPGP